MYLEFAMKKVVWIASLLALASSGVVQAAGDVEAGKAKSAVCAACHGADGNGSANPLFPKLAGQHPKYIIKQLRDFKTGARKNDTMAPMAAALNDQDIENVAAYFSSQNGKVGQAAADKVAQGEQIYRAGLAKGVPACIGCHGPTGSGNAAAGFPSVSGQHAAYVVKQLKDFREGVRSNDPNSMMRGVTALMNDRDIEAVAQYVQGLH
jgi:cytochrome c553